MTAAFRDSPRRRKARGAFFTPPELCSYVANWAIRGATDRVLEPSCGEAAFLLAAGARLRHLGSAASLTQLTGVELHLSSAAAAQQSMHTAGHEMSLLVADFFAVPAHRGYDAVVGNPPYVRYQEFAGEARARGRAAALAAGVGVTGLASSWAAFTVHAAEFLRPGGRLGLVLPAELLTVNYAAAVRQYLMAKFGHVQLVLFTERVFPGVSEEVVLLLADDALAAGGTDHCELRQLQDVQQLHTILPTADSPSPAPVSWRPLDRKSKWTTGLLSHAGLTAYTGLQEHPSFTTLHTWGETTLGMVTGNNNYFALSPERVRELGLQSNEVLPLSPPGSRHLRGLKFTGAALTELGKNNSRTWLFYPPLEAEMSAAARAYIEAGEADAVHSAYKCRKRKPWWRVPLVPPADLLLTYMNADTPRLTTNEARVRHLNSVHGVYLRHGLKTLGAKLLPIGSLNSMTLLGAETVGRSYGGGMLKLEPGEADLLPVPAPALLSNARPALLALRPQLAGALRNGKVVDAARMVDDILLVGELGMRRGEVRALEEAHAALTARRLARGKAAKQPTESALVTELPPRGLLA